MNVALVKPINNKLYYLFLSPIVVQNRRKSPQTVIYLLRIAFYLQGCLQLFPKPITRKIAHFHNVIYVASLFDGRSAHEFAKLLVRDHLSLILPEAVLKDQLLGVPSEGIDRRYYFRYFLREQEFKRHSEGL